MFSKKKKKERSDGHSKKLMSPTVMSQSAIASSHDDPGYNTGDSSKLPNNISLTHRPSVCSALSDSSTSSYYTATNVPIHDSNQVSSVSTPERPAEISMKELLQSVEVIVHSRITELEQKVEISHRKLEARLDDVEKQIHKMLADAESRLVLTEEQRVVETPVSLPILKEVNIKLCIMCEIFIESVQYLCRRLSCNEASFNGQDNDPCSHVKQM